MRKSPINYEEKVNLNNHSFLDSKFIHILDADASRPKGSQNKVHKYTSREGTPGNYKYTYADNVASQSKPSSSKPASTTTTTLKSSSKKPATSSTTTTLNINKKYDCSGDNYNCDYFSSKAEAQKVFELCGGVKKDVHKLDGDKDGLACEYLH